MTDWQKKYRWQRTWGDETGLDGNKHEDYSAYDGEEYVGRIRLDLETLKRGSWYWAGALPSGSCGTPIMPNAGYCTNPTLAARAVEIYWDAMKARRDIQALGVDKLLQSRRATIPGIGTEKVK